MENNKISWKAGTSIYKYNDDSDYAYLLKEGEVEIRSVKGISIGYINKNEVFGEQSILLGTRRTVNALASKDTIAYKIPKRNLLKEYKDSSIFIQAILRSTYLRLTNLSSMIEDDLKNINNK